MRRSTSTGCLTSNPALCEGFPSENLSARIASQINGERERLDHVETPTGVTDGFPSPSRNLLPPERFGRPLICLAAIITLLAIWASGCDADKMAACSSACGFGRMVRFSLVTVPGNNEPQSVCVCADHLADGGRP